jgi:hypothetical protein
MHTTQPSVTRFKERHNIMFHRIAFVMAVGLCLLGSRQQLHATMLAHEPFAGYSIATLNGQLYQGTGLASGGSWANQDGSGASASATSLTYPGVVSTGGKAVTPSGGFNGVRAQLDVSGGGPFATAGLVQGGEIGGGTTSGTLYASSAEFVGEFWFGEASEVVK